MIYCGAISLMIRHPRNGNHDHVKDVTHENLSIHAMKLRYHTVVIDKAAW